jgi:hypothetical protein
MAHLIEKTPGRIRRFGWFMRRAVLKVWHESWSVIITAPLVVPVWWWSFHLCDHLWK